MIFVAGYALKRRTRNKEYNDNADTDRVVLAICPLKRAYRKDNIARNKRTRRNKPNDINNAVLENLMNGLELLPGNSGLAICEEHRDSNVELRQDEGRVRVHRLDTLGDVDPLAHK